MREYGLREPEFSDMEIGFRINRYRNTEDALEDTTQGAEKTTQVTQGTTQGAIQVGRMEEDKAVLMAIKEQQNIAKHCCANWSLNLLVGV